MDLDIQIGAEPLSEIGLAELVDELTENDGALHVANNLTEGQADLANQELVRRGSTSRIQHCTKSELLDLTRKILTGRFPGTEEP